MKVVDPKSRPRPFSTPQTHARLRHDYATWHDAHSGEALRAKSSQLPFDDKSKFDSAIFIDEVIGRSYGYPAMVAKNGNHLVVFDFGHNIGWDAVAKRVTSSVTVVIKPSVEFITVHPRTPWSKDQSEA